MPIYEYRCAQGHLTDAFRSVAARHDLELCATCGALASKAISRPAFAVGDIKGYRSTLDGKWIGSRSAHREHLRKHDVIEVGNERLPARKPKQPQGIREDIERAIGQLT
jgi:putative FmdB family regulatory protein